MTTHTIQSLANEMLDALEHKMRDKEDENSGYWSFISAKKEDWMHNIVYKAHGERFPNDYIYEYCVDALELISDSDNVDNARECIYEVEADVYTHNLTAWLHDHIANAYYLEDVVGSGVELLAEAQRKAKIEVAESVLNQLEELTD